MPVHEAPRGHRVDLHPPRERERIAPRGRRRAARVVRRAAGAEIEAPREHVGHLLGEEPVARQLAADHRVDARRPVRRVIDDLVLARERVLGGPERVERGPHARVRADRARLVDLREDAGDALDQVPDLLARRVDLIEIAVEVVVGRADDAHVLPRLQEDLTAVDRPRA